MDSYPRLARTPDGNLLLSYASQHTQFLKIDTAGNTIWQYSNIPWTWNSQYVGAPKHILVTKDSGAVFGGSIFWGNHPTGGFGLGNGFVFKLDKNRHLKWATTLRTESQSPTIKISRLAELDNGHIVAAGSGYIDETKAVTVWVNVLDGVTGDSLWSKHYYPVGGEVYTPYVKEHHVYDMELTASGHLVLCGETICACYAPEPQQQGWLMRIALPTDFNTGTAAVESPPALALRLYPNPASDYVVVDVQLQPGNQSGELYVHDMQGRLVLHRPIAHSNSGFIIDLNGWPPGNYAVSVPGVGAAVLVVSDK